MHWNAAPSSAVTCPVQTLQRSGCGDAADESVALCFYDLQLQERVLSCRHAHLVKRTPCWGQPDIDCLDKYVTGTYVGEGPLCKLPQQRG